MAEHLMENFLTSSDFSKISYLKFESAVETYIIKFLFSENELLLARYGGTKVVRKSLRISLQNQLQFTNLYPTMCSGPKRLRLSYKNNIKEASQILPQ
jgi:hypothetical protein